MYVALSAALSVSLGADAGAALLAWGVVATLGEAVPTGCGVAGVLLAGVTVAGACVAGISGVGVLTAGGKVADGLAAEPVAGGVTVAGAGDAVAGATVGATAVAATGCGAPVGSVAVAGGGVTTTGCGVTMAGCGVTVAGASLLDAGATRGVEAILKSSVLFRGKAAKKAFIPSEVTGLKRMVSFVGDVTGGVMALALDACVLAAGAAGGEGIGPNGVVSPCGLRVKSASWFSKVNIVSGETGFT